MARVTHRQAVEAGYCPPWEPPYARTTWTSRTAALTYRRGRTALVKDFRARYAASGAWTTPRLKARALFDEFNAALAKLEAICRAT